MPVVSHPDQITPAWLAPILHRAGWTGTVHSLRWKPIGAGQMGDTARFLLEGSGSLPPTLVGKFPAEDPVSRQTAVVTGNYRREVFFFNELAAGVDIALPRVLTTEFDQENHDYVILMEDLAPGRQIDQIAACSVDEAALALSELARLHGPRWGDAALAGHPLLLQTESGLGDTPVYNLMLPTFIERYAARLGESGVDLATRFQECQAAYSQPVGAKTLIHLDYRLDNMIFGGPRPLTVLDWQSITMGCALLDVSYFVGTSLKRAQRPREERALLAHYLEGLKPYGISLTWDDAWTLYRRFALAGLFMAVIASVIVGETERGNDMFMAMARRSIAMAEDLDALALLAADS